MVVKLNTGPDCKVSGQETPVNEMQEAGAAAAGTSQENMEAYLRSKDVTCGICMDKVYEKTHPRNQMFGILPNCSHAFCLQCIRTWRKTKDFGPDVVKYAPVICSTLLIVHLRTAC